MQPSSSGDPIATFFTTYTNLPNYVLLHLFTLELSRPEWKLYLYLRYRKNNGSGQAWPGVRKTVDEAHISRRQVKPARDRLECLGLITTITRPGSTSVVEFNDEQIKEYYMLGVTHSGGQGVTHSGGHSVTHCGQHTITNTTTTTTTSKGARKKKEKKSPSPLPGAKTKPTKRVAPTVGNTTHRLLKSKTEPTYEAYLKHGGNQWKWSEFKSAWKKAHT